MDGEETVNKGRRINGFHYGERVMLTPDGEKAFSGLTKLGTIVTKNPRRDDYVLVLLDGNKYAGLFSKRFWQSVKEIENEQTQEA